MNHPVFSELIGAARDAQGRLPGLARFCDFPDDLTEAEELYTVLAGEAEFLRERAPAETLGAGQSSFHASNQPHAMETHDQSVVAYVIWRNNFGTDPALTERDVFR